jgi:ABC-type sugar transport system substrate-binding protein
MKKRMAVLLTGLILLSLVAYGCSSNQSGNTNPGSSKAFDSYTRPVVTAKDKMKVVYLISNMTDESNIRSEQQAEIEAKHRGWDYQVINYETSDNFRQYFQNAINQKPTAIIIGITQSFNSYQDLVATARNQGIGVYSNDNSVIDGVISNSTMDNKDAARMLMDQVIADHGDSINAAVYELAMSEVMTNRANEAESIIKSSEHKMTLLASLDLASTGDLNTAGFTVAQTWLQQFGDKLNFIFCGADTPAMSASEAITQAGDPNGNKTFVAGVDGGSASWHYIRSNTPLKYTYSQPFEYFTHQTFEIINQIQVEGLNPGDQNCLTKKAGDTVTAKGIVTTVKNVPKVGDTISSVFNYYGQDPNDKNAWYNWNDGPGIYTVTDSKQ